MRSTSSRWLAALLLAASLSLLGACSDDDSSSSDSSSDDSSDTTTADGGGDALTQADGEAFLAAAVNGNGDEAYSECLAEKVKDAVDAGDLAPDDVRAWTNGEAPTGVVQDFISQQDVVVECTTSAASTTTG